MLIESITVEVIWNRSFDSVVSLLQTMNIRC